MILERLELSAFGKFSGDSLDLSAGPKRFHLIYGPNEAGKSTCLRAISALFFGIPRQTSDNFLHANPNLRVGATLFDETHGRIRVFRRKGIKSTLLAEDGKTPVDPTQLSQMLGGIDEDAFHNRFGLSHEQLVAGGRAVVESKGELGEILFAAGAGLGQLKSVQNALEEESKKLFLPRGKKAINVLIRDVDEKRKELRELQTRPAEYKSLVSKHEDALSRSSRLQVDLDAARRSLRQAEAYRDAIPIVATWIRETKRIEDELKGVPTLDAEFTARRRESVANWNSLRQKVADQSAKLDELRSQLESCRVDSATIDHAGEITSLFQDIAAHNAATKQRTGLEREIVSCNRRLEALVQEFDIDLPSEHGPTDLDSAISRLQVGDSARIRISELAGESEIRRQQVQDAAQTLASLRKQLSELDDEIERTPVSSDADGLAALLDEIGNPSQRLDSLEDLRSECDRGERECIRIAAELRLGRLDLATAVLLQPPSEQELERHEVELTRSERAADELRSQVRELEEQLRENDVRRQQLSTDSTLPTEQELAEARSERDRRVDQLDAIEVSTSQIPRISGEIRSAVANADAIIDAIRVHHEKITLRASLQKERVGIDSKLQNTREALLSATECCETAASDWAERWSDFGIPVKAVHEMRAWILQFRSLRDRYESLEQSRTKLREQQVSVDRQTRRVSSRIDRAWNARPLTASLAVGPTDTAPPDTTDLGLAELCDLGRSLLDEISAARTRSELLKQRRDQLLNQIPEAEAKYDASVRQRDQWDSDWRDAVQAIAGSDDDGPSIIAARLQRVSELAQLKRERDDLERRVRSIIRDGETYEARIQTISEQVGLDQDPARPIDQTAQLLYQSLLSAQRTAERRATLTDEIAAANERLVADQRLHDDASALLDQLCREAGTDTPDELPEIETLSSAKRESVARRKHAEEQLTLISGDQDLNRLIAETQTRDPIDLENEIAELNRRVETLAHAFSEAQQEVGGLASELARIDGGDRAALLQQEIESVAARIDRDAQTYARLRIAAMLLKRSIEHYRSEHESPVLKIACETFEQLTCGRYSGLRPEYDENGHSRLFGIRKSASGEEQLVPVDGMSVGTADALYLAMRVASLEHQLSFGHRIPVVIDDCLIQLDDERCIAALRRFSKLSEQTQVILFTHHRHLIDLATEGLSADAWHRHEMPEQTSAIVSK